MGKILFNCSAACLSLSPILLLSLSLTLTMDLSVIVRLAIKATEETSASIEAIWSPKTHEVFIVPVRLFTSSVFVLSGVDMKACGMLAPELEADRQGSFSNQRHNGQHHLEILK